MSRRNAFVAGVVAWLLALLWAPDHSPRGLALWAVVAAAAVALAIVGARVLSRELRRAVLKDKP
jgi:hypothetical protein